MVTSLRRSRWKLTLLGATIGAVFAVQGQLPFSRVALADVATAVNAAEVAVGGPMDGQPAQSPAPNTTYPPGAPAGGSQAVATSSPPGLVLAAFGFLALVLMAGGVGMVLRHRRLYPGVET